MPEIKHTFTAGKMNKDLDLRLVRNGEYRDANNVQVRTTDADSVGDGSAGTAQNLKGNKEIAKAYHIKGYDNKYTKMVGGVADEKNNKAYFFAASPVPGDGDTISLTNPEPSNIYATYDQTDTTGLSSIRFWVDSIIEVDTDTESSQPVFVDVFAVTGFHREILETSPGAGTDPISTTTYSSFVVKDTVIDQIRVGMRFYATYIETPDPGSMVNENAGGDLFDDSIDGIEIVSINPSTNTVYLADETNFNIQGKDSILYFVHPERVLNFNHTLNSISNSINIIDNLLFWSDGVGEPKKINIKRSLKGTVLKDYQTAEQYLTDPKHTKLMVKKENGELTPITSVEDLDVPTNSDSFAHVLKEHVTVIRKKPTTPPTLEMRKTSRSGDLTTSVEYGALNDDGVAVGGFVSYYTLPADLDNDGVLNVSPVFDSSSIDTSNGLEIGDDPSSAEQAYLIQQGDEVATNGSERYIRLSANMDIRENDILKFSGGLNINPVIIEAQVIQGPIFYNAEDDTNGYIIKCIFVDSRLAAIVPTSWDVEVLLSKPLFETKFGRFGYRYKYEDGECSAFSPWSELAFLPGDFSYSPKSGFNSGMENNIRELIVRGFIPDNSVRPHDVRTVDILFKTTDDANVYVVKSITREIDDEWEDFVQPFQSDSPSNEFEAPEAFGKLTITSEMINRVLESNQLLRSWDNVPKSAKAQEVTGSRLVYGNYFQGYDINKVVGLKQTVISNPVSFPTPEKSIKSIRTYKWGMVFGDKYGRETPVLPSSFKTDSGEIITGDATVEKSLCHFKNNFQLQQDWKDQPHDWMNYVKYYVKEVSSEYYNLIMDRYFDSGDDGLWISFNSADRNKVDLETYLILKNEHGNQAPVLEPARYKILAIENEAPDFIKRKTNFVGDVVINRNSVYGTSSDVSDGKPVGLIDTLEILTDQTFDFTLDDFRGTPKVKIRGTFSNDATDPAFNFISDSPFRDVAKFVDSASDGVFIDKTFSDADVNMYTKINNQLTNLGLEGDMIQADVDTINGSDEIVYTMRLFDEVTLDGPEFNGKFFVKIQRNETLDAKVTTHSSGGDYEVLNEFDIAYITNTFTNPASIGARSTYQFASINTTTAGTVAGFTSASVDDTMNAPTCFNNEGGPNTFNGFGNNSSTTNTALNIVNNGSEAEVPLSASNTQGVPDFGPGDHASTKAFWQNWFNTTTTQIFLDEAPAAMDYTFRKVSLTVTGTSGSFNTYANNPNRLLHYYGAGLPISYSVHRTAGTTNEFAPDDGSGDTPVDGFQIFGDFEGYVGAAGTSPPLDLINNFNTDSQASILSGPYQLSANIDEPIAGGFGVPGFSENYKPPGISTGYAADGQYGQLTFSCIANNISTDSGFGVETTQRGERDGYAAELVETYPTQFTPGTNANFKNIMQEPGTLFRFTSDPAQSVYRVLQNLEEVNEGIGSDNDYYSSLLPADHEGPLSIHRVSNFYDRTQTVQANLEETASLRSSFIIRFARVGQLNETIEGTGIDIAYFDPRGNVRHDGSETFGIQILDKGITTDDGLFIQTTHACWETEPKETTDLDIYYEASPAIPMVLKSNNLQSFVQSSINASLASRFYVKPRVSQNMYEYVDISDDAYVHQSFQSNIIEIKHNYALTETAGGLGTTTYSQTSSPLVTSSTTSDNLLFETTGINLVAIGDEVCFERPDGYQTKSKVLDHMEKVVQPGPDSFKSTAGSSFKPSSTTSNSVAVQEVNNQTLIRVATYDSPINGAFIAQVNGVNNFITDPNGVSSIEPVITTAVQVTIGSTVSSDVANLVPSGTYVKAVQYKTAAEVLDGIGSSSYEADVMEIRLSNALTQNVTGSTNTATFTFKQQTGIFKIDRNVWKYPVILNWFNCYSFGNGVESDRIRDDFNTPTIDNGCRVSSTFLEYGEENISSGLIHSGLYNSISSVNNLNEFNMAEKITKNINPSYGSIQALESRDNNIVVFSEDKVLKVLANKDAVFNADGNPQLVATNRVLGDATPYAGNYGISNNPESLASDSYRIYFADRQRGAVLRLSRDGLTPISDVGMRTYFRENLKQCDSLVGTFDGVSGEYNLTLKYNESSSSTNKTVSFNEGSKGWVSFKSFVPTTGVTVAGKYLTTTSETNAFYNTEDAMYKVYEHYRDDMARNNFYGKTGSSSIEIVFNDLPSVVKSFKAVNYEGTQGKIINMQTEATSAGVTYTDEYYNLDAQSGWYVNTFTTDMQVGQVDEFIKKENKWFNRIISLKSNLSAGDLTNDMGQIAVQGLGNPISSDSTGTILSSSEVNIVLGELPPLEIIFLQNYSSSVSVGLDTGLTTAPKKVKWTGPNGLVARNYISSQLNGTEVDFAIDGVSTSTISSTPYLTESYFTQYNYNGDENQNYIEYGEGLWTITIEEFTNFNAADDPIDFSSRSITGQVFLTEGSGASTNFDSLTLYDG